MNMGSWGDGTTNHRTYVVDVSGLSSGVTAVAVGGFELHLLQKWQCALLGQQQLWAIGQWQLSILLHAGARKRDQRRSVQVSAGWSHSCAI